MASNDNTSCLDGGQLTDTIINKNSFVFQSLTRAQGGASRLPEGWLGQSSPAPCPQSPAPFPGGPASLCRLWEGERRPTGALVKHLPFWGLPFLRGSPLLLPPGPWTPRWPGGFHFRLQGQSSAHRSQGPGLVWERLQTQAQSCLGLSWQKGRPQTQHRA